MNQFIMEIQGGDGHWRMVSRKFIFEARPDHFADHASAAHRFTLDEANAFITKHDLAFVRLMKSNHLEELT